MPERGFMDTLESFHLLTVLGMRFYTLGHPVAQRCRIRYQHGVGVTQRYSATFSNGRTKLSRDF